MLRAACRQVRAWQLAGCLRVAVNMSIGQLRDSAQFLRSRAREPSSEFGVDPALHRARDDRDPARCRTSANIARVLRQLGELGCGIAVDDFGTGYSIAELPQAAAHRHAQDRSLVRARHRLGDRDDAAIVSAVVAMAQEAGAASGGGGRGDAAPARRSCASWGATSIRAICSARPSCRRNAERFGAHGLRDRSRVSRKARRQRHERRG